MMAAWAWAFSTVKYSGPVGVALLVGPDLQGHWIDGPCVAFTSRGLLVYHQDFQNTPKSGFPIH
jgi:hypothetical protein